MELIEIANSFNSTEENHVYDTLTYSGYETFQPKTSVGLTEIINPNLICVADQTLNGSKCPTETDPVYINTACQTTVNEMNK